MRRRRNNASRSGARRESAEPLERRVLLSAGDLDPSFGGGDGIVTDYGAADVVIAPGGKIVAGGGAGVVRYNPDGTLDPTFGGGDGRADIAGGVTAVAVHPDGGVIALAPAGVVRFAADGSRDMAFGGGDGVATAPAASGAGALLDVGVQPGGRIVASTSEFIGLVGFDPAGNLDTSFARGGGHGQGVVGVGVSDWFDFPPGGPLAVQPDGYVVVAGSNDTPYRRGEGSWPGLAAIRFTPDGAIDPTFSEGPRLIDEEHWGAAQDVAIAPDGRIVVVGRNGLWSYSDVVYRLLPGGTLDTTFGSGGSVTVSSYDDADAGHPAAALQADGKILLAGGAGSDFGILRLNRDGTPDTTFGPNHDGVGAEFEEGGWVVRVAVQPDGRIVAASPYALARYQGDGPTDGDDEMAEAYLVPRPSRPIQGRTLDGPADVDLYRFDVAAGRRVGFDVDRYAGGTLDAYLRVFDSAGRQLGSNDDAAAPGESAPGGDAYVEVTFPAAGTYYAGVSSAGNTAYNPITGAGDAPGATTGGYSLALADRTPRAAGEYDFRFGDEGLARRRPYERGIAVLPDGGYVAATYVEYGYDEEDPYAGETDLAVARYTAEGLPQMSFGRQGISGLFGFGDLDREQGDLVTTLPDGRILAVGTKSSRIDFSFVPAAVVSAAYDLDGTLAGGGGFPVSDDWVPKAAAVLPDGRFFVAGTANQDPDPPPPESQDFFVARFNADRSLDRTFSPGGADGDGIAVIDVAGDDLAGLAVLPDGKMLLAGTVTAAAGADFAALRLNPDASPDPTFGGGDGIVTTDFGAPGGGDTASALVLLPGGKFVLAGGAVVTDRSEVALARYNPDGTLDPSFGSGGKLTTRLSGPASAGAAVADGDRILVGGRQGFGLARYTAGGALDTSFGASGFAATPAGAVSQILPLPDGNWLVNGSAGRARHFVSAFPGPQPQPPGGTRVYQAEDAAVAGAIMASSHARYTGTGYVDYLRRVGDYVEFTVEVPTAGIYFLDFRYANGGTYDRPLVLAVNGQAQAARLSFRPTGSWGAWRTSHRTLALPAGRSTVRLTAAGVSGPNLDALTLRPPPEQTLQAEEAALFGAVAASSRAGYTGTGYADYLRASGDYVEWEVNLPSAGLYELSFRYANGGTYDRPLELGVNGQVQSPPLSFAPTGGWSAWRTVRRTVSLAEGVNTLRLTSAGLSGPNLDLLTVALAAPAARA